MAITAKIAAETDKTPVIRTCGDTWTRQLFVLADCCNVRAADPDLADADTADEAKHPTASAATAGFGRLRETHEAGCFSADFGAATTEDGIGKVATGEGVHYPMPTFAVATIQQNNPEEINDVGFFVQPGDVGSKNGVTVWMPAATDISKTTDIAVDAKIWLLRGINLFKTLNGMILVQLAHGMGFTVLLDRNQIGTILRQRDEASSGTIEIVGLDVTHRERSETRHRDGNSEHCPLPASHYAREPCRRHVAGEDAQGRDRRAGRQGGRDPAAHRAARPQAQGIVRRPAPARRHRPGDHPRPQGLPARRALVDPRRGTARADADRAAICTNRSARR